jgi:hypothetical protein
MANWMFALLSAMLCLFSGKGEQFAYRYSFFTSTIWPHAPTRSLLATGQSGIGR